MGRWDDIWRDFPALRNKIPNKSARQTFCSYCICQEWRLTGWKGRKKEKNQSNYFYKCSPSLQASSSLYTNPPGICKPSQPICLKISSVCYSSYHLPAFPLKSDSLQWLLTLSLPLVVSIHSAGWELKEIKGLGADFITGRAHATRIYLPPCFPKLVSMVVTPT